MANAQVEKLKALGLRHGEKAVVGLAAALCVLFLVFAAIKPSIDLTPEQVNKDAEAARSGMERRQEPADILTALEQQQIKNPGYTSQVESQEKNALNPADFKVARSWVTPEPGAGLIRDTPELIAPSDLYAYPGRGGALVFALDPETKKRVPEDPNEKKAESEADKIRRSRKRPRRGASGSAMAGAMPMAGAPTNPAEMTEEQKKQFALDKKKREALLAGTAGPGEEKKAEAAPAAEGPFKEVTKGLRWVGITGVIDHKKLRDNYLNALKDPAVANPNYKQLGVERQSKQSDGTWSDWEPVDTEKNHEVIYNLPEEEEELTPENVRLAALVDPLPFLKAGYWERVHVASLVPKEKREIDPAAAAAAAAGGPGLMGGGAGMPEMGMAPSPMPMMGPGITSLGGPENTNFPTTEAPTVMIRSLDFTVDQDTTYRFRLRIEVFNPNYNREDVSPGTDTKSLVLQGPWSEPTNEVTMPADVTAYAMRKVPAAPNAKRNDKVLYQIVSWNPDDGVTVKRNVDYGPGQIVGEVQSTRVPVSDGSGAKSKLINFNSHQLMLDETGGDQPHSHLGVPGQIDVPAVALLLRPDGSVLVRNETSDLRDPVRKDISDNYDREIEESTKRRENSNGGMGQR